MASPKSVRAIPKLSDKERNWYILKGYNITIDHWGNRGWWLNGKRHREDGPAIEYADGDRYWFLNGKLHREDGPAIEHSNGSREWWLNGKWMSEEQHRIAVSEMKNAPAT